MALDPTVGITWYKRYSAGNRSILEDVPVSPTPATLYTDSTTLTTGMTLYDNTGTDTGLRVGEISGDGFYIQTETVTTYYAWSGTEDHYEKIPGNYPGIVYTTTENPSVGDIIYTSANGNTDTIMHVSGSSFMSNGLGTTCSYTRESQYDNNNLSTAYFVTLTGSGGGSISPIGEIII